MAKKAFRAGVMDLMARAMSGNEMRMEDQIVLAVLLERDMFPLPPDFSEPDYAEEADVRMLLQERRKARKAEKLSGVIKETSNAVLNKNRDAANARWEAYRARKKAERENNPLLKGNPS